ncbi:MAG: GNAT family N-acetyltransferase [Cyclobacteriaceae bacterium]|nr:GNAT family N-acetyltransferase [Cyclobacteriaceae bacterium]
MKFLPIDIDDEQNIRFMNDPEQSMVVNVFTDLYRKVGFDKPWIAYFVQDENDDIVGGGGYKGKPTDGRVEISYGTFKKFEGLGVGTAICKQLIAMARQTDPTLTLIARTLPDNEPSIRILKRNGFEYRGVVFDEEDGDVLEWALNATSTAE